MPEATRILIVEDLPTDAELAQREIKGVLEASIFQRVDTCEAYLAALERFQPDLIISDYSMPSFDGLTALKLALERAPLTPVIILTGSINEDTAVECMKAGAADYVLKEYHKRLGQAAIHALEQKKVCQERQRAEESLRESEERLRLALMASNQGLYDLNLQTGEAQVSAEYAIMLGYDPAEFHETNARWIERLHPDDRERVSQTYHAYIQGKTPVYAVEFRQRTRSGGWKWILSLGKIVTWDAAGQPVRMLGTHTDITERKQMEQALHLTQFCVDQASVGIIRTGSNARILNANHQICQSLGYTAAELGQMHIYEIDPNFSLERWQEHRQALKSKRSATFETIHRRKDGSTFPVEITSSYIEFQGEGFSFSFVRDISERKQAEGAFAHLSHRLELILNSAGEGIYGSDEEGIITFVNPAMAQMLGWEAAQLIGQPAHEICHHSRSDGRPYPRETCPIYMSFWRGQISQGDDEFFWRKDGTGFPVEYTSTPIRENGRVTGTVVVVRDITERKRAEEARAKLEEELRQTQKMESIGRLAGGVAHDFNNLLTVIRGYSEFMQKRMLPDDPHLEDLGQIRQASERATSLTRQLLAFSRKQILAPAILDLNTLITELHKMLGRLIGEDITLALNLNPGLWSITADPGQMEQVIMNLVVNARDAMPTGGRLTIETQNIHLDESYTQTHPAAPPGPCVMLTVTDTGHGMDKSTQNRIFEPFFTTKESGQGTGLGLATVFGIVKQSGGDILVYSEPNQGSTFKIFLPANKTQAETSLRSPIQPTRIKGHETILLVEDEEQVRTLVRNILQDEGYTILETHLGSEALLLAQQHQHSIDLLMTDVIMPQMSGRVLAEQLKTRLPKLKVLFMSGYTDDAVVRHGLLAVEVEFLSKPFSPIALLAKVREVLDK